MRRSRSCRRDSLGGAARGGPARRRLSGVHDYAWLARLRRRQARPALPGGGRRRLPQIKLKVGADLDDDIRRLKIARAAVGPDIAIAIDANQRWGVDDAVTWIAEQSPFDLAWMEEPTSPDDILGHAAVARAIALPVATGEHAANGVIFKQILQAGSLSVLQIDASRVGGVNENMAILLLAAKFGVPVCPHAGGVGLCEAVQHLSMFDYVAVSGSLAGRRIEYVDHLHEHLATPVELRRGRYLAPLAAGAGTEIIEDSLTRFAYPDGAAWCGIEGSAR